MPPKIQGGLRSRISENKKNPNHDSRKLKFSIFENFTNHGESIRDKSRVSRIKNNTPITDHGEKMVREKKNACVAVKRGVGVRCNCNIFNLDMENVLKGLPDKISCPDIIYTNALQMYTFF